MFPPSPMLETISDEYPRSAGGEAKNHRHPQYVNQFHNVFSFILEVILPRALDSLRLLVLADPLEPADLTGRPVGDGVADTVSGKDIMSASSQGRPLRDDVLEIVEPWARHSQSSLPRDFSSFFSSFQQGRM